MDGQRVPGDPWVNRADPVDSVFNAANQRALTTGMKGGACEFMCMSVCMCVCAHVRAYVYQGQET